MKRAKTTVDVEALEQIVDRIYFSLLPKFVEYKRNNDCWSAQTGYDFKFNDDIKIMFGIEMFDLNEDLNEEESFEKCKEILLNDQVDKLYKFLQDYEETDICYRGIVEVNDAFKLRIRIHP